MALLMQGDCAGGGQQAGSAARAGRGLLGAVGRPLSGALSLVSSLTAGLATSVGPAAYSQPPRAALAAGAGATLKYFDHLS